MKIIIINQAITNMETDSIKIDFVDTRDNIYSLNKLLTVIEGKDKQNYIIIVNLLRAKLVLTKYNNKYKLLNVNTGVTYYCYENVKNIFLKYLQ